MSVTFVTTATKSYIPLVRVLMESVRKFHPDARRVVVQMDGEPESVDGAEIIRPADVITDPQELAIRTGMYNVLEFTTSLKPRLLMHELESSDQVIFLDPDTRLFQAMDRALAELAAGSGVLLTPHQVTEPSSYRNWDFYEWVLKLVGVFNTGFVGVTREGLPFLEWWDERLRRECIGETRIHHWVDQKIVDFAPAYFDVDVLRDPAYNVGWWNLEERPLSRKGDTWMVGDVPLVMMHYSDVRPAKPKVSEGDLPYLVRSERNGVVDSPEQVDAIRRIETEYIADLMAAGYRELSAAPYAYAVTPQGRAVSARDRRRYRELVLRAEEQGTTPPMIDTLPPEPLSWKLRGVRDWARDEANRIAETIRARRGRI